MGHKRLLGEIKALAVLEAVRKAASYFNRLFFAAIALVFLAQCGGEKKWRECVATSKDTPLKVMMLSGDDSLFGGANALYHYFRITNTSEAPVTDIQVTVNKRWSARLKGLQASKPLGTARIDADTIAAGDTIELHFSHDVTNHLFFKDEDGEVLPRTVAFEILRFDYEGGHAEFHCSENDDSTIEE